MKLEVHDNYSEIILTNPVFEPVLQAVEKMAKKAYIIGGFVRDLLLQRPSKDIDIMVVGSGIELASLVHKKLGGKGDLAVYKNFGTALIHTGDWKIEFVGARKESYREDSRKPIVEDGTFQDDQQRRDFTINALALSLNKATLGDLIDPFNGLEDLQNCIIRTPLDPSSTFSDDPLRMMRAVRFASQLGFDIEPETSQGIIDGSGRLKIISGERIIDEFNKVVLSPVPSFGINLMFHLGLLKEFFPEMVKLHGVDSINGKKHKDNFYHTLKVLDNLSAMTDNLWLRWSAILHDIAKPNTKKFHPKAGWTFHGHEDKGARMVPDIFRRLKLPLDYRMKFVQKLVRLHLRPIALVKAEVTDSAVRRLLYEAGDDIEALMKLCRADITSKNDVRVKKYMHNFDLVEEKMREVEEKDKLRNFQPPISGKEIMETFDLPPGRIIGTIKEEIREAILEGRIKNDYQDAKKFMHNFVSENKLNIKTNNLSKK